MMARKSIDDLSNTGRPAIGTSQRAVPKAPNARNLRAIGAEREPEPLPNMLTFDSSRVSEGGYSSRSKTLYVRFVDGTPWEYYGVERNEWRNFRRSMSPGRYINRVLNGHDYGRGDW